MKPYKCSKCGCELNVSLPYNRQYVKRDTGSSTAWYHTDCLRKMRLQIPVDWNNIFDYTQNVIEESYGKDALVEYIFNRYMLDWDNRALEKSVCVMVEKAHKGELHYKCRGKKIKMKQGIDYSYLNEILIRKKNELNKLNKKNFCGYDWFIWDLSIVIKRYSEGYRLPVSEVQNEDFNKEQDININYINREKALAFNNDSSDDVLGDDL